MATTPSTGSQMLGSGIAFPLRLEGGTLATNAAVEHVKQSIVLILCTAYNERVMRPDFGGGMERLVFEPMNAVTVMLVQHQVQETLKRHEPRIDVLSVVAGASADQGCLKVEISYRIKQTGAVDNLVYPFYLASGELR